MTGKIRQAIVDGVLLGVQQHVVTIFNNFHPLRNDLPQQHRAQEELIEVVLAAEEMLKMIEELTAED
jgi:hypothetical protein